jgi:HJR/Mrr/RecB family endonuclease
MNTCILNKSKGHYKHIKIDLKNPEKCDQYKDKVAWTKAKDIKHIKIDPQSPEKCNHYKNKVLKKYTSQISKTTNQASDQGNDLMNSSYTAKYVWN